jgi:uncharacterized membrane protein
VNRAEFLAALGERLTGLPQADVERSLEYYGEMLDDRMEDGMTEEQAVAAFGPVDEIAAQILLDTPLPKLVKAKVKPRRALRVWEIVLLVLGSPIWLPLLLAAAVVLLSVYIVLWALVVTLYAVVLSFGAGALGGAASLVFFAAQGHPVQGAFLLGCGLVCAGFAIALFLVSNRAAVGAVMLGRALLRWIKSWFVGRRKQNA